MGSRLRSKWEFLSRKNNETVYFYCIFNEKSIDPPLVPAPPCLQHNNRTAANCRLIWERKKKGEKKERKAIYWLKMWTVLSSQIIKVEWSCNCCLRKIISPPSDSQKTPSIWSTGCLVYTIGMRGTHPEPLNHSAVQRCTRREEGHLSSWGDGGTSCTAHTPQRTPAPLPSLRYPLSYSRHKWICQLTFQGPEQQMISSSKAEDKENKSLVFCWEKKRPLPVTAVLTRHRLGVRERMLSLTLSALLCFLNCLALLTAGWFESL